MLAHGIEGFPYFLGIRSLDHIASREDRDVARMMLEAIDARGARSVFLDYLRSLGVALSQDAVLSAIALTLAWGPLMRKRISRLTAETIPWHLRLYGAMLGASAPSAAHGVEALVGVPLEKLLTEGSIADFEFRALTGRAPGARELSQVQILTGLLISNGPGAISAQGAKGSVSADGPQEPGRVHLNKAMAGFLTHTGFSHGGNGYEGIAFLLEQFRETGLADPSDPAHGLDLAAMATDFARSYRLEKTRAREFGSGTRALPGIHHPVFRGKHENFDPRERFVARLLAQQGSYNIFHSYYGELVRALHREGASADIFCVNIDGVIAALLLALLWDDLRQGRLSEAELETAAFTVFLYGRMIGAAAEIDDHLNRGRNMDVRTPASQCHHVA